MHLQSGSMFHCYVRLPECIPNSDLVCELLFHSPNAEVIKVIFVWWKLKELQTSSWSRWFLSIDSLHGLFSDIPIPSMIVLCFRFLIISWVKRHFQLEKTPQKSSQNILDRPTTVHNKTPGWWVSIVIIHQPKWKNVFVNLWHDLNLWHQSHSMVTDQVCQVVVFFQPIWKICLSNCIISPCRVSRKMKARTWEMVDFESLMISCLEGSILLGTLKISGDWWYDLPSPKLAFFGSKSQIMR